MRAGEFVAVGRLLGALRRSGCPTGPAPTPSLELGPGLALALRGSATLRSAIKLPMRPLALPVPAPAHWCAPRAPAPARIPAGRRSGAPWAKPHRITRSGPSRVPWRNVHERQRWMLIRPCHGQLNSQPASGPRAPNGPVATGAMALGEMAASAHDRTAGVSPGVAHRRCPVTDTAGAKRPPGAGGRQSAGEEDHERDLAH